MSLTGIIYREFCCDMVTANDSKLIVLKEKDFLQSIKNIETALGVCNKAYANFEMNFLIGVKERLEGEVCNIRIYQHTTHTYPLYFLQLLSLAHSRLTRLLQFYHFSIMILGYTGIIWGCLNPNPNTY